MILIFFGRSLTIDVRSGKTNRSIDAE